MAARQEEKRGESLNQWFMSQIHNAKTIRGLEFLGEILKLDAEDGEQYTKDAVLMGGYRSAWKQRYIELSK